MASYSNNELILGSDVDQAKNLRIKSNVDGTFTIERENGTDLVTISSGGAVSIKGTSTNDNAAAGYAGEFLTVDVPFASPVAISAGVNTNVMSLLLSAGDWDVSGIVGITPAVTTSVNSLIGQVSTVSATLENGNLTLSRFPSFVPASNMGLPLTTKRISLAAPTTVYLVIQCAFSVSTCGAYGNINARRVR